MDHSGPLPLDLVFSFDTTGSMSSVINEVRDNIAEMLQRLSTDIPDIRVAAIAHGDYGDRYETEIRDFGTRTGDLVKFVKTVAMTFGSDEPECYELVLQQARTHLTWRPRSTRALVLVGDSFPHEVGSARNKYKIDWKAEVQLLKQLGVTVYCVQCRSHSTKTQKFMQHVADETGGLRLPLSEFRGVCDFLMAIAYREGGTDVLQDAYEREVRAREGSNLAGDVSAMLGLVKRTSTTTAVKPTKAVAMRVAAARKTAAKKAGAPSKKVTKTATAAVTAVGGVKPVAMRKRRSPKTVRVRRETCSTKNLPAPLASLSWSSWRLVGQAGSVAASSWQQMGSGSVRRSLVCSRDSGSSSGSGLTYSRFAVELAVQPRPGARRFTLFGRVVTVRRRRGLSVVTFGRLLSGRTSVRAQLQRVLRQGMRVFARVAHVGDVGATPGVRGLRPALLNAASYAWNSGRSVRGSGVFVSVGERSLRR